MFTNRLVWISLALVVFTSITASAEPGCRPLTVVAPDNAPMGKYFYQNEPGVSARDLSTHSVPNQHLDRYDAPDVRYNSGGSSSDSDWGRDDSNN